jgi:hypothetical protein
MAVARAASAAAAQEAMGRLEALVARAAMAASSRAVEAQAGTEVPVSFPVERGVLADLVVPPQQPFAGATGDVEELAARAHPAERRGRAERAVRVARGELVLPSKAAAAAVE